MRITNRYWIPALKDINMARRRIGYLINETPIMTSRTLNGMVKADLFFKCENLQKVGSFKFRGAVNAVMSIPGDRAGLGVATAPSRTAVAGTKPRNHQPMRAIRIMVKGMVINNSFEDTLHVFGSKGLLIFKPTLVRLMITASSVILMPKRIFSENSVISTSSITPNIRHERTRKKQAWRS